MVDIDRIINISLLIISLICFIQSFTVEYLHLTQENLKQGFFEVVFLIVTFECILYFLLLSESILLLLKINVIIIHIILGTIIFFSNLEIIFYNILTLNHLMNSSIKKDKLIEKDMENKDTRSFSISLKTHSFLYFHVLCFIASFVFTVYYCFVGFIYHDNNTKENIFWYFLFIKDSDYLFIIILIPSFFYLLFSIPYLFISKNKEEISDKIKLKNYSLYCFLTSLLWLIYSSSLIFIKSSSKLYKNKKFQIIFAIVYLLSLLICFWYRSNAFYVTSIIYDGNISILKIINCLKILFCLRKVKKFSSIDYNNAYLTHALASKNDFITEDDIGKSFDQSISYKS